MPSSHKRNHLRSHRKQLAFSQQEAAFLLGVASSAKISRYEKSARIPSLETALAIEAVYQRPVSQLYPELYDHALKQVKLRAHELMEKIKNQPSGTPISLKLRNLTAIINSGSNKNVNAE